MATLDELLGLPARAGDVAAPPIGGSPDTSASGLDDLLGLAPPTQPPAATVSRGTSADALTPGNAWEGFLNTISLPNYAVAGAAQGLIDGEGVIRGALSGMEQHTTFGRVLQRQGMSGPLAGILGFGLDVALDPTTYVGVGALTKLGAAKRVAQIGAEVATFGGRTAEAAQHAAKLRQLGGAMGRTAAEQASRGERSLLTFAGHSVVPRVFSEAVIGKTETLAQHFAQSAIGQSFDKMFRSALQRAPEALRGAYMAAKASKVTMAREVIDRQLLPAQKLLIEDAKRNGIPYKVAAAVAMEAAQHAKDPAQIAAAIQHGKLLFGAPQLDDRVLENVINTVNGANAMAIALERRVGLPISELIGWQNYVKRAITDEGLDAVRAANPAFRGLTHREFAVEFGAQIQRDEALRDLTVYEINELARQGKLSATGFKPVKEFFYEDPLLATAYRMDESARAVASAEFLKGAAAMYGVPHMNAPAGYRPLASTLADQLGLRQTRTVNGVKQVVADTYFPGEVAELLDSHYERIITPQYLQPFMRAWDKMQGAWKSLTLPIWPSYHTRNLLSDTWMMTLAPGGMPLWRLPQRATQAISALRGGAGTVRLGQRHYSWGVLKQLAEETGVVQRNVQRDLDELMKEYSLKRGEDITQVLLDSRFMRMAMAVGEARENAGRMAFFIEQLAKGLSPEHAAMEVKKRLYEYADLSDFEKQVLRRVFPFYSWARKNIAFQMGAMLQSPGYAARFQHMRDEIAVATGAESLDQGVPGLPKFLRRGSPVPAGMSKEGLPRFLRLQNIVPIADVTQLQNPGQMMLDMLSPFPKAAAEMIWNVDLFRNEKLEKFPGERENVLGVPVPKRLTPLTDLVRPVAEASRLNPFNVFGTTSTPGPFGIPQTSPDISAGEKLANYLFARTYEVDPMKQQQVIAAVLQGAVSELKMYEKRALMRGDTVNATIARRRIEELMRDPRLALEYRNR